MSTESKQESPPDFEKMAEQDWANRYPLLQKSDWESELMGYVEASAHGMEKIYNTHVLPLKSELLEKDKRIEELTKLVEKAYFENPAIEEQNMCGMKSQSELYQEWLKGNGMINPAHP